jgi:hypothetical protein
MSGSLVQDLRYLIAAHSLKGVHEALQQLMAEEYAFLSSMFQKGGPASVSVVEENAMVEPSVPAPLNQKKLKVTVKKAVEAPVPAQVAALDLGNKLLGALAAASGSEPVSTEADALASAAAGDGEEGYTGPVYTAQEKKKFQKDAEVKKHAELTAQGATLSSILTKENLKKWIEDEGHTYSWVAREKAGCPVAQVTAISKSFGIESKITKKQAMTMIRN